MRIEGWVEGLIIVLAGAVLLVLSRSFRLAFFGRGAFAAGLALTVCWTIISSFMLLLGSVPALGLMLLILFPALEEGVRVFFVYAVLPRHDPKAINYLFFAAGCASVEVLYKICLLVWLSGGAQFDALGTLMIVAVPGSALFFFGIMMSAVRAVGLPGAAAFLICAILHSAHNIAASSLLTGENPPVAGCVVAVFGYLILAGIALQFIRAADRATSGADPDTPLRESHS